MVNGLNRVLYTALIIHHVIRKVYIINYTQIH